MIKIEHISKSYQLSRNGSVKALDDVSFSVGNAELFGLIGPDGSGKTTLFRIINNLILKDSGSVYVDGLDASKESGKLRKITGYMPSKFSLYQDLSVEENLNFFAKVFKVSIKDNFDLIEDIYASLSPFKKRLAGRLSGGMKQKLALCCTLIQRPKVLLLDEPTTGVDPVSRQDFWNVLLKLKSQGMTILVSTPYMEEASLCDKIAFISEGRILKLDTTQNIINQVSKKIIKIKSDKMFGLLNDLRAYDKFEYVFAFGDFNHATLKNNNFIKSDLESFLKYRGHSGLIIEESPPTVEDAFIEMTR